MVCSIPFCLSSSLLFNRHTVTTEVSLDQIPYEMNSIQVTLVGTYLARYGTKFNHFTRAILSLPDINRLVFPPDGDGCVA